MYSYEDRIRAVKLYIKLGKRMGPTIRQLGYPTKNSLKSWHREYEQSRDLQAGGMHAQGRNILPNRCIQLFSITLTKIVALLQLSRHWDTHAGTYLLAGLMNSILRFVIALWGVHRTCSTLGR